MVKRPPSDDVGRQVLAKAPRNQTSWTKFPGIITRVYMKNFMCHAQLDYRPTERLNFLHGANGSGKVSVMGSRGGLGARMTRIFTDFRRLFRK